MPRKQPQNSNGGMILNADSGTVVAGEQLKQVDTPVETLMGAANGAVSGALVSGAVSAAVTIGKEGHGDLLQKAFRNITGNHLVAVLAGTAAFAVLGGLVRYSRAKMHNQWSEKHYDYLENRKSAGFVDQLNQQNEEVAPSQTSR